MSRFFSFALGVLFTFLLLFPACSAYNRIEINLAAHSLALYQDNVCTKLYPIAIGKYSTPSPTGDFEIISMEMDPIWTDPETMENVDSGDWNPLGYRWIGFYGRYGVHGNSNPDSIGSCVSNGCIRMFNEDVEELFEIVDIGTPVHIFYDRMFLEIGDDGRLALYVYPDCYDEQPADLQDVVSLVDTYGFEASRFIEPSTLAKALEEETGEAVYLGRISNFSINTKDMPNKLFRVEKRVYFPVDIIAKELRTLFDYDSKRKEVVTPFGYAPAVQHGDNLYVSHWEDIEKLFNAKVFLDSKANRYYIVSKEFLGHYGK